MLHLIGWIVSGLIIGAIARFVMPGRQSMSIPLTILLGLVGALVGGGISYLIWGRPGEGFSEHAWPGYILAILGAVVVLWAVGYPGRRRIS